MALDDGAQFGNHHTLVALDVALDKIDVLQRPEELAAATHLSREAYRPARELALADEVAARAEVTRLGNRVVGHLDGGILLAQSVIHQAHIPPPAHITLQHREDNGHRLNGIDTSLRTHNVGHRASVVAEVCADVDGDVAPAQELRQVVVIFQRPPPSANAESPRKEEQAAHDSEVALKREHPIEQAMQEFSHRINSYN